MEPVATIIVPGLIGGLVIALCLVVRQHRTRVPPSLAVPTRTEAVSPHFINMASIRVEGLGGLGLVAMAAAVALNVPRIGQVVSLGLALGAVLAIVLVRWRTRSGAMPWGGGRQSGANVMLSIEGQRAPDERRSEPSTPSRTAVAAGGY